MFTSKKGAGNRITSDGIEGYLTVHILIPTPGCLETLRKLEWALTGAFVSGFLFRFDLATDTLAFDEWQALASTHSGLSSYR